MFPAAFTQLQLSLPPRKRSTAWARPQRKESLKGKATQGAEEVDGPSALAFRRRLGKQNGVSKGQRHDPALLVPGADPQNEGGTKKEEKEEEREEKETKEVKGRS